MKVYSIDSISDELVVATYKIDGVKGIKSGNKWVSRAGNDLYNLPLDVDDGEYEIYLGDFKSSISAVKTHGAEIIDRQYLYSLSPVIDKRLEIGIVPKNELDWYMKQALKNGYEGLVVRGISSDEWFKIKNVLTFDVEVIDIIEGTGRNIGRLGAFLVKLGDVEFKVGTGFNDKQRIEYYNNSIIGKIIEITGMELFESGRVRHPRFNRLREDLK